MELEGSILQPPVPVVSAATAHKTFGPTDLTSMYCVCTRRVFGGIGHRTQAFRSWARTQLEGYGSPVVKVSNHGSHVMSSSPVPLRTRRVGQRCTSNLSRAETSSRCYGSYEVSVQVSSTSLDHGSK
ncbi:hypothetical protein TNCV_2607591 [Trichonephila clavipes]|uniref:Uncharacterized protein n=1 Tax=Trichonephila clavipes TaxID=2585209 RepID=A0A8X6RZ46_TRICX|nr:hypothetical protein TNCV_2607591 [Trichonephila clavipes]